MAFDDLMSWDAIPLGFGVEFTLSDGVDTVTIKVSDNAHFAPEYQPCLESCDDLTGEAHFGDSIVKVSDFSWTILNNPLQGAQAAEAHDRADELFGNNFTWKGQTVVVKLLALDQRDGTIEKEAKWYGKITNCEYDQSRIRFEAIAMPNWLLEQVIPTQTILRADYPDAPDSSIGLPIPIVMGNFRNNHPTSRLWSTDVYERAGIARITDGQRYSAPCIRIADNFGKENEGGPVYYVCGHEVKEEPDPTTNTRHVYINMPSCGQMGVFDEDDAVGYTCADYTRVRISGDGTFSMFFYPDAEQAGTVDDGNSALNPLNAVDRDDTTYATMDSDSEPESIPYCLKLKIARPPDLGFIEKAYVYALITEDTSDSGSGMYTRLGVYRDNEDDSPVNWWPADQGDGVSYTQRNWATADRNYYWLSHELPAVLGSDPFFLHADDFPNYASLRLELHNIGEGHAIYIYALCLVVYYSRRHWIGSGGFYRERVRPYIAGSDSYPRDGEIFAALLGMKDDGSGTYTGTPSRALAYPSEMVHYLVDTAGCTANTSLTPGDLSTARTYYTGAGIQHRVQIGDHTTYAKVVGDICYQAGGVLTIRFSDTMQVGMTSWALDIGDMDYDTRFIEWADVRHEREFKVGFTGLDEIANAFYIDACYSHPDKRNVQLCLADGTDSDDGLGTDDYGNKTALGNSESDYGRREFHARFPYAFARGVTETGYFDGSSEVSAVRDTIALQMVEPRVYLRFSLPWKYHDLQVGHAITIDDTWRSHIHYPQSYSGTAGSWERTSNRREFVIERLSISPLGYIEVEASRILFVDET